MKLIDRLGDHVPRLVVGFVVAAVLGSLGLTLAVAALVRERSTRERVTVIERPSVTRMVASLDRAIRTIRPRQARALLERQIEAATPSQLVRLRARALRCSPVEDDTLVCVPIPDDRARASSP